MIHFHMRRMGLGDVDIESNDRDASSLCFGDGRG
jgi:hypothetical protein